MTHRYIIQHIINRNQDGTPRIRTTDKAMFFDINFEEFFAIWKPGTDKEEIHADLGPEMSWTAPTEDGSIMYKVLREGTDQVCIERYRIIRGIKHLVAEEIYTRL